MLVSSVVTVVLCELGSRLVLNRVDYLSPTLVRDDILGIRVPPGSGGHDAWGFRNAKVPASAPIVTVGDSHTYGNCAKMNEAWPKVLGRLMTNDVYNLGMGGYGPNQYYYLLKTKAVTLKPATIVCGFYMGDDFDNAYRITYGLDYWSSLRRKDLGNVDPDIWEKDSTGTPTLQKRLRMWLSEHSVLYRLVVHGLLENAKAHYQIAHAPKLYDNVATLMVPDKQIEEAFLPKDVLRGLDQKQASVQEGMRLTFDLLAEMNAICASNHIRFVVAVIPTKETVFARYLEHNSRVSISNVVDSVIANERIARQELLNACDARKIAYVNLLPALEKASERGKLYTPGASDMHPGPNGYRVIAEEIARYLKATAPQMEAAR